jgi:hypothetical protein
MTEQQLVQVADDTFEFLQIQRAPAQVLAEAQLAAVAIRDVIAKKVKPVVMNGEQYLEYEDWQTVGRFYGITAEIEWTRYCEFAGARGFEARAVAKHALSGRLVSAGESMCLNDEPKWSARPKYEWKDDVDAQGKKIWVEHSADEAKRTGKKGHYKGTRIQVGEEQVPLAQLRSMAQTRAAAKALRNVLAWVVVLAGYRATPAEELETERDGNGGHRVDVEPHEARTEAKAPIQPPQRKSEVAQAPTSGEAVISEPQAKRFYAIAMTKGWTADELSAWLKTTYGLDSDRDIPRRRYDEIVTAMQEASGN